MGTRGTLELVAALPAAAAGPAHAVMEGVAELASLRHAALGPDEVRALAEVWQRLSAQVDAARLGVLAAMDARDDVVPKARAGQASAVFGQHVLGQSRAAARRDGLWASLLRAEVGDLPATGATYAAGDVTFGHVEVVVRAYRRLGSAAREQVVDCRLPLTPEHRTGDGSKPGGAAAGIDIAAELTRALHELSGGFTRTVRQVLVVDAILAVYARALSVPELAAVAERVVDVLNPPSLSRAHARRYLHMSSLPDGSWVGRFSCGQAQGLLLKAALAAGSGLRPGRAIDADGAEHEIPDTRDLGARQLDALLDLIKIALTRCGITLSTPPGADADRADAGAEAGRADIDGAQTGGPPTGGPPTGGPPTGGPPTGGAQTGGAEPGGADAGAADVGGAAPEWGEKPPPRMEEPPAGEGVEVVVREPGVLYGPYPSVGLTLIAGIEHAAAALAADLTGPGRLPMDLATAARQALHRRLARRRHRDQRPTPPLEQPREQPPRQGSEQPSEQSSELESEHESEQASGTPPDELSPFVPPDHHPAPPGEGHDLDWLSRALSPYAGPARLEHAGPVDPVTLGLLACSATIRAALLAPSGALLDLGRTQRVASPTQRTALLARDQGCVIPGCTVPGDACDAHHVQWWSRGGSTDLDNLALVCDRHHHEIHHGEWHIDMRHGVPWVAPPTWINQFRPYLRNAVHHPAATTVRDQL